MKVKLTYFKAFGGGPEGLGGKYYCESEAVFLNSGDVGEPFSFEDALHTVETWMRDHTLPGLVEGHSEYHVLVATESWTHMHLLVAKSFINPNAEGK